MKHADLNLVGDGLDARKIFEAKSPEVASQFSRLLRIFVILSAAVMVSLIIIFSVFSSRSYDRAMGDAEKLSQTLANLIDDQVYRSLQNVQLMLTSVREVAVSGEANPIARISDVLRSNPLLRGILLSDADGKITFSSYAQGDIGWSLAEDELFKLMISRRAAIGLGVPVNRRSYADATPGAPGFIPAAIPILDHAGAFKGLAIAALNPTVFQLQSQEVSESYRATVDLIRFDGVRLVDGAASLGRNRDIASTNPIFTKFLPDRERGTFHLPESRETQAQIVSFTVTQLWPVVVSVGIDRRAALEGWREDTLFAGFIMLVPILLIAGSASLMGRQIMALRQQSDLVAQRESDAIAARYQLELAINAMSDGFCYFDSDDRLVLSNSTYRGLYPGISHLIVPGQTCREFCEAILASGQVHVPPDQRSAWIAARLARHRDSSVPFEEQLSDGRWLRVLNRETPDGGWVGLRTDITELKLREQQLLVAREAADAANIAKSQFLAQMSHEIRTPMNGIMGMSGLLADTSLDHVQAGYVGIIEKSAQSLLRVINDILDFSQLEAGRMTLEPVSYDLGETIHDIVGLISAEAAAKNLPIQVRIAAGTPTWLYGDQDRLRQILVNLLANAVKFTEAGEVVVTVDAIAKPEEDDRDHLEIAVADTGVGISQAAQARLFRHFEQGEVGVHRRYGGSGLGLAICRKIVNAMGGEIGVESEPGQGSRFWVRLPVRRSEEPRRRAAPSHNTPPSTSLRLHVLVAEDNQINQRVIRALLERLGHTCQLVANGREAVRAVQDAPFDIVLMDVQMPEMDGVEATRAIRALGYGTDSLPIIAVTANVLPGNTAKYLGAGMNSVLSKPIIPESLDTALNDEFATDNDNKRARGSENYVSLPSVDSINQIDKDVLSSMREVIGAEVYNSLISDLDGDVKRHLAAVKNGLVDANLVEVGRASHSLSSLLATFGLTNAGAGFARVEELLRDDAVAEATTLAAWLAEHAQASVSALKELDKP